MSSVAFDFNAFLKESKEVIVSPKAYFATMKTTGGIAEPLIKAVIYGVVAGIIAFIWSILGLSGVTGGLFGGATGVLLFFSSVISAVIGLFIGGVIILVISAICKGSTDFEANVRVSAAIMVIMPINALFGFVSGLNFFAGAIVSLIINLFALYLLYHALNESLKAKPETSRIVTLILAAVLVLFMLLGLGAKRKASQFMNEFNNQDFQEVLKDLDNN